MPQNNPVAFAEAERYELERVVEALSKSPRLSRILQYMGEKLSSGEVDHLTEYNIATEVLGRSKTAFNAADDAIARVETHRLRKRLATFYESEGKDHPIQVALPAGSYVPVFVHKTLETSTAVSSELPQKQSGSETTWDSWSKRRWGYLIVALGIVLFIFGTYLYNRRSPSHSVVKSGTETASAPESVPAQTGGSSSPIRILAGYSGPPRTDSAGRVWSADQFFSAGGSWRRAPGPIARASDQFLFEHSRTGDFSYNIPLKPGFYELHLFFSTPVRSSEGLITFSVLINGEPVLVGFDINVDALGDNVADERVFRGLSPGKDGFLRISFTGETGAPSLNALEILPGLPKKQLPIRLVMQTTPLTDSTGHFWRPDNYFMNGRLTAQPRPLVDTRDPDLFASERFGHFTYAIPVDTRGTYTVVLHFVELYFGPGASGNGGVGSRSFKVMCNGEKLLDTFDIFKEAGSLHEVTKTFRHVKPTAQGKINLTFEPIVNNATISGIEILDESE